MICQAVKQEKLKLIQGGHHGIKNYLHALRHQKSEYL